MISAAENIYNIMENVHLRLFLYQSSPLESKWSLEITLEYTANIYKMVICSNIGNPHCTLPLRIIPIGKIL